MSKTIVFGAAGQLGTCIKQVAEARKLDYLVYPAEEEADILNLQGLKDLFEKEKPSYVINCAAYTAVDKAEDEVDLCRRINRDGAANLARLCNERNVVLVHVSTDFVFEGNRTSLLKEDDEANPIGVYGLTKLEGEREIRKQCPAHFIIRTSWLYSEHGNNFVKTMLKLGREKDQLNIIADQIGTPTYAVDLAGAVLDIIASASEGYGTYHYSNEGVTSWYDFAKGIFDISDTKVKVNPIPTSAYPTKARRPAFSVMDKTKIKQVFGIEIPYWRDSLQICLRKFER